VLMRTSKPQKKIEGFTLVEILVAAAIGAAIITAAVIGFGVISQLPLKQAAENISLPAGIIEDFYGTNAPFITIGSNPNYFQAAQARQLKERLLADVSSASAVFCLGRDVSGSPAARLHELPIGDSDFRTNATPGDFRNFLVSQKSDLAAVFPTNQSDALLATTNASIFVVAGLESTRQTTNSLLFRSVYEIDFIPATQPSGGTFASVRRYGGTNLTVPTHYYHVYYPGETNGDDGFRPLAAFFRRTAAANGGNDPFAKAANQPFTFVWWPDPLVSKLVGPQVPRAPAAAARANYAHMAERTSLFFVLPAFPPL
jgi:hypothetical protein